MPLPDVLIRIDLAGQAIGAVISFLIAYHAHKGYKISRQRSLFFLYLGFILIGLGLLIQSGVIAVAAFHSVRGPVGPPTFPFLQNPGFLLEALLGLGDFAHWILVVVGYALVFAAYFFESEHRQSEYVALQLAPFFLARFAFNSFFELITLVLLVATLTQVAIIYFSQRFKNTLFVLLGFLLLTLSHLTFIFFPLSNYDTTVYIMGHAVQLAGFLFLLFALTRKVPVT